MKKRHLWTASADITRDFQVERGDVCYYGKGIGVTLFGRLVFGIAFTTWRLQPVLVETEAFKSKFKKMSDMTI